MTPAPIPSEALAGLHGNVVPPPVSLFPATRAWLVVAALFLAVLAWGVARVVQQRRRNRYRREAAAELRGIEARLGSTTTREAALAELPVLVKRVALHLAPRGVGRGVERAFLAGVPRSDLEGRCVPRGPALSAAFEDLYGEIRATVERMTIRKEKGFDLCRDKER